jgi:hypothetical protein
MVILLPLVEQQSLSAMIGSGGTAASVNGTTNYPAGRPSVAYDNNYLPWTSKFSVRFCPSDSNQKNTGLYAPGTSSYRACNGDYTMDWNRSIPSDQGNTTRGAFRRDFGRNFNEITDGTSNTLAFSEGLIGRDDRDARSATAHSGSGGNGTPDWCLSSVDPNNRNLFKNTSGWVSTGWNGRRWASGDEWVYSAFQTIQAPNTPTCVLWGTNYQNGTIAPPSSNHTGGVNAACVDGSVHFINSTVGVGDSSHAAWGGTPNNGRSLYGVWGAMGSINGGESETAF